MAKKFDKVTSLESLEAKLAEMREAQAIYSKFTQEQVDEICKQAAMAADKARIPLAKMANAETGMGVVEDKVIKNHYASEHIYQLLTATSRPAASSRRTRPSAPSASPSPWASWAP